MNASFFAPKIVAGLLASFALLACQRGPEASDPKTAPPTAAEGEKAPAGIDIDELLKREATGLSDQVIKAPDASWSVTVSAAGAPTVQVIEDMLVIEVPIGGEAKVRCQVFPKPIDPGGTLWEILANIRKSLEFARVAPAGVHVVAGAPAAFVDTIYVTDSERGRLAGNLKLAIHAADPRPVLCLHDEMGYRSTFEQVSKSFFGSFKSNTPPDLKPTYLEISKTRIDDVDVGFSITRYVPGQNKGELTYMHQSTQFVPASPKDLNMEDSYKVLTMDTKGRLTKGVWIESEGGELTVEVTATRLGEGKYAYEGEVSGKQVKGSFEAKTGIATPLETMALIKKKLSGGGGFSEKVLEYYPSLDPTAVIPVTYSHNAGAAPREVQVRLGDHQMTVQVDEQGMPASALFPVGKKTLRISREFVQGKL
ncbi:MAG TPA: hypothetical protein VE093_02365 [Polyangiaceae bacterium]|nr:hypothetical protein [Polyangiaceae bacterium]